MRQDRVRRQLRTLTAILSLVASAAAATADPPSVIIERIVTVEGRSVRVTLFSNQEAVTSVRQGGEQVYLRHLRLDDDEYIAYLGAVNRDAEAAMAVGDDAGDGDLIGVLRVLVPGRGVEELPLQRAALFDLPVARLSAALDDLEMRLNQADQASDELAGWKPRRGDVVELMNGGRALVLEVRDDGLVTLAHDDVAVVETVSPDRLPAVVRRVIKGGR